MPGLMNNRFGRVVAVAAALVVLGAPAPAAAAPPAGPNSVVMLAVSDPSITSFTPAVAAPGDAVTLQVTNLDPIVANTTVSINGVAAAITARTTTSLTITVPNGTGGGKITITGTTGSFPSTQDLFVVPSGTAVADVSNSGRLTIGTKSTVTVPTGKAALRLVDVLTGDRLAVLADAASPYGCLLELRVYDTTLTQAGSMSSCTSSWVWIDTMAAATAGVRTVALRNNNSSAGSADVTILRVPADTNLGTLPLDGTAKTVTLGNAGQNGYLTFAGTVGQRIALQSSNTTGSLAYYNVVWGLYRPDGTLLGSSRVGNAYSDTVTLPTAGTYQLYVDPSSTNTGSITFTAWTVPADASLGTLTLDGVANAVSISNPAQNGYLTFTGTTGQRIALQSSNASGGLANYAVTWGVYAPDGTNLGGSKLGNSYLDTVTLPASGTYQLRVDPTDNNTGSITFTAWIVPADANLGTLTTDGITKTVTISSPAQNGYLTFTGTAGQSITVTASNTGSALGWPAWTVKAPDGSSLGTRYGNASMSVTLTASGSQQLYLNPDGNSTGSITFAATSP